MPARGQTDIGSAKYQFYETATKVRPVLRHRTQVLARFCEAIERPDLVGTKAAAPVDFAADDVDLRRELQRIFHS